jgi:hypothetical protein
MLTEASLVEFDRLLRHRSRLGGLSFRGNGLTDEQLLRAEEVLGFSMPFDLKLLLRRLHDPDGVFFPWRTFRRKDYLEQIEWVAQGILFDVEKSAFWWSRRWGDRPADPKARGDIVRADMETWPKLLPLTGHRFLPAQPLKGGNPVLSIHQTDIIYYGVDLLDWLGREFTPGTAKSISRPPRPIPVWDYFLSEAGSD